MDITKANSEAWDKEVDPSKDMSETVDTTSPALRTGW